MLRCFTAKARNVSCVAAGVRRVSVRSYARCTFCAFLLFGVFGVAVSSAQDVAILWDVSKSVSSARRGYQYPQEIRDAVLSLVFGRGVSGNWNVPATQTASGAITRALNGSAPLFGEGARLIVIRFGTRFRDQYHQVPFFWHQDFTSTDRNELERKVSGAFPADAREQLTNKDLAIAAAARYLFDQGSREWILLVVSDFAQDSRSLDPEERQVRDAFLASEFAERSPAVVIRWRTDPDLQIYLESDRSRRQAAPEAGHSEQTSSSPDLLAPELLAPVNDARLRHSVRPTFSWRGPDRPPENFFLVVTRVGSPVPVLQSTTQATAVTAPQLLPSGKYQWQVFAKTGGNSVASARRSFLVEGGFSWWWVVLALVLLAIIVSTWFHNLRRTGGSHG